MSKEQIKTSIKTSYVNILKHSMLKSIVLSFQNYGKNIKSIKNSVNSIESVSINAIKN